LGRPKQDASGDRRRTKSRRCRSSMADSSTTGRAYGSFLSSLVVVRGQESTLPPFSLLSPPFVRTALHHVSLTLSPTLDMSGGALEPPPPCFSSNRRERRAMTRCTGEIDTEWEGDGHRRERLTRHPRRSRPRESRSGLPRDHQFEGNRQERHAAGRKKSRCRRRETSAIRRRRARTAWGREVCRRGTGWEKDKEEQGSSLLSLCLTDEQADRFSFACMWQLAYILKEDKHFLSLLNLTMVLIKA
jgi:hypothetical protein